MLWILLFWSIASFSAISSQGDETRPKEPLLRLLPLESDLKGWKLDGEPQTAEGIGLFELINGGAEEYVKEGFRRAVMATYRNTEGKLINLDIYEMLSPESARSIHRKKAGDKGTKVPVGEEAAMEEYYLNFQKGLSRSRYPDMTPKKRPWNGFSTWVVWSLKGSAFQPARCKPLSISQRRVEVRKSRLSFLRIRTMLLSWTSTVPS